MNTPTQPVQDGRFVTNKIVEYLYNHGGISMNDLAMLDFTDEDRVQYAQLIGYSLGGWSGLSYVTDEIYKDYVEADIIPFKVKNLELQLRCYKLRVKEAKETYIKTVGKLEGLLKERVAMDQITKQGFPATRGRVGNWINRVKEAIHGGW